MRLSIIIPAFNVEKYIKNTINSILNQTEKNFEVIFVDDGSTDNTLNIMKQLTKDYTKPFIKIINKSNGGVSSARNLGLKEAKGDYVLFLDGDDFISNNLVESIYQQLNYNEPEIICWGYNIVNENGKTILHYFKKYSNQDIFFSGIDALRKILIEKSMWIWTGSAAYKREFLLNNNLRYVEGCANGEDQEFTYKALVHAQKVVFINEILSFYVLRKGSITNSFNIKKFDAILAFKRTAEYFKKVKTNNLEDIINIIEGRHLIENYIGNYISCLNNVNRKNIVLIDIEYLEKEIDINYPGIIDEIKRKIKIYIKNEAFDLFNIKVILFYVSPILYYYFVKIKQLIKIIK